MKVLAFDIGIKNLAYAIVEKSDKQEDFNVIKTDIFNLDKKPTCYKCNKPSFFVNIAEAEVYYCCKGHANEMKKVKLKKRTIGEYLEILIKYLDTIDIQDIDKIIIENQPAFMNPTCKSISVMVMTIFAMKQKSVSFQNPSQKVFGHKFEKSRDIYKQTKSYAIKLCKELISKENMKDIILLQKCDDICDAILHACYYLNNGKIPEKIKDLI